MSTYTLPELRSLWGKGDLTVEQAVGHPIQNLLVLSQRLAALEKPNGQPPAESLNPPDAPPPPA